MVIFGRVKIPNKSNLLQYFVLTLVIFRDRHLAVGE